MYTQNLGAPSEDAMPRNVRSRAGREPNRSGGLGGLGMGGGGEGGEAGNLAFADRRLRKQSGFVVGCLIGNCGNPYDL